MARRRRAGWLVGLTVVALASALFDGGAGASPVAGEWLPSLAGAAPLHADGLTGRGVTVAVLVGPGPVPPELETASDGRARLLARFDAVEAAPGESLAGPDGELLRAMLSSRRDASGRFEGAAPDADLVLVRAVGVEGRGRRAEVALAIEWVVANRDRFGIRVLHLPVAAPAWRLGGEDPLAGAVVDAWRAGIVVVAPAGNGGPAPVTVAVPGDVPAVITVGAVSEGAGGERPAGYSAGGPSLGGFVKPEILAPAGAAAVTPAPDAAAGVALVRSGTAISSAVVSGIAALLLEQRPWLTPDEVKLRLLAGARPLVDAAGGLVSAHRQGAGLVDARAAAAFPSPLDGDGGAGAGRTWSEGAGRTFTWSEVAGRTFTWSESGARTFTWSESSGRTFTWSEVTGVSLTWCEDGSRCGARGE